MDAHVASALSRFPFAARIPDFNLLHALDERLRTLVFEEFVYIHISCPIPSHLDVFPLFLGPLFGYSQQGLDCAAKSPHDCLLRHWRAPTTGMVPAARFSFGLYTSLLMWRRRSRAGRTGNKQL